MNVTNEFYQVDFTAKELQEIPRDLLAFFTTSSLATDEISMFQKLYVAARNTVDKIDTFSDDIYQKIAAQNLILLERNLAAKLFEYIKMYVEFQKRSKRKKDKQSAFSKKFFESTSDAIKKIISANGYGIIDWYRNSVANHYSLNRTMELLNDPELINNPNKFSLFLHEKVGGSHYILGEQLILTKFTEGGSDWVQRTQEFQQWMKDASGTIIQVHQEFCAMILDEFFQEKKLQTVETSVSEEYVMKLSEAKFPLAWDLRIPKNTDTSKQ